MMNFIFFFACGMMCRPYVRNANGSSYRVSVIVCAILIKTEKSGQFLFRNFQRYKFYEYQSRAPLVFYLRKDGQVTGQIQQAFSRNAN